MEWIKITYRLPEEGVPVLIYEDGIGIGFYRAGRFFGLDFYKNQHNPTHWMPLPEPPKE